MKKTFASLNLLLGLSFLALSPLVSHAQVLTKADVETLSPQISSLISTVGATLSSFQAQTVSQNASLAHDVEVLGNVSRELGAYPPPTEAQINSLALIVAGVSTQVATIATWRHNMQLAVANISKILGSIGSIIASAV